VTYERKDAHYRRAKAEGFRARSAYKLSEIADRHRLLERGDHVVDLGAWPGGWAQVALDRIGREGRLVALDLVPLEPFAGRPVDLVVGDVRDPATIATLRGRLGRLADVVLSDLAPKLSGVRARDDAQASELVRAVVAALPTILRPGGRALVKVFMSADYQSILAEVHARFDTVRTTRAEAARRGSAELYLVCLGYLAS
jgi:23S rRNA (uridine2552-2'-O)-methyltransferase